MPTFGDWFRENTSITEELASILERSDKAEVFHNEHAAFADTYNAIRGRLTFITASMESIENDGISQAIMHNIQVQLPGIAPDVPLNGYTKALSRHNVGYALESLGAGKNALTSGGLSGLLALVLKALQWCITTIKGYLKSRREINKVGLNITGSVNQVGSPADTPDDIIAKLVNTKEFVNAANGYAWLISIREDVGAPYAFDQNALTEWWPELLKEMEYEYRALRAMYDSLFTGETVKPNISSIKESAAFSRFFKAMPQGIKRDGKPCTVQEAMADFNRNPMAALTGLGTRLSQMFILKLITNKEELARSMLQTGRSIETYTAVDRVVYDSLNNMENNRTFDRLHADFTSMYKAVQNQNFNTGQAQVDTFVSYVNLYAEKMNAFSRLVTLVSYLDSMSYTAGENMAYFMARWVELMKDRS